jgi:3-hydroxyacyl-[acyl-carrier-protein] dehydratase
MELNKEFKSLNFVELLEYQPNRYPFLMIDYVDEYEPGVFANGFKNLTNNEWFFPVHFQGAPNMPGALQLEAMAQMLTVAITSLPGNKGKVTHALSHKVRFRKEVFPGDCLRLETKVLSWKRGVCKGIGKGFVKGELVCDAEMLITIPEIFEKYLPKTT